MSGERYLFEAAYTRLATDAAFVGLCSGGIWTGALPNMNDVAEIVYSGGTAMRVTPRRTIATPTWVEIKTVPGGGALNDASDRFNDVSLRLECISLLGPLQAIDAAERLDDLFTDYALTIPGQAKCWKAENVNEGRSGGRAPPPLTRPIYRAWSVWRFRYGT